MDSTEKLCIRFVLNLEGNVKIYKNQICNKIFQNMKSDPKTFWNLLNKLSSERIQDEFFNQTEFIKFFQNLNVSSKNIPNNEFHDNIIQKLKHLKSLLSASNSDDELMY
jgi:hypothetical protein